MRSEFEVRGKSRVGTFRGLSILEERGDLSSDSCCCLVLVGCGQESVGHLTCTLKSVVI